MKNRIDVFAKLTVHLLLVSVLFSPSYVCSQVFNTKEVLCDDCEKNVFFTIESTSFLKNNEYFDDFTKGFTGIGFFAKPTLNYYVSKSTKLNAGVYLLKYSGLDNFSEVIPVFSVQQKLGKHLDLIFGNLYGTLNHRLKEPLFRFDRYYQNNMEYGLQFWYHSPSINSDLWVNWEKFIFKGSPFQEVFTVGSSSDFTLLSRKNMMISVPLQLLIFHKGGQIDSNSNPVSNIFNGVFGADFKYFTGNKNSISLEPTFFVYKALSTPNTGENSQHFTSGKAFYLKLKYRYKRFNLDVGYWKSNKFIAPRGEYLFSSVSEHNRNFSQAKRNLLTTQISFSHQFSKSVHITLRANGYLDTDINNLSHSAGLYLVINDSFLLHK